MASYVYRDWAKFVGFVDGIFGISWIIIALRLYNTKNQLWTDPNANFILKQITLWSERKAFYLYIFQYVFVSTSHEAMFVMLLTCGTVGLHTIHGAVGLIGLTNSVSTPYSLSSGWWLATRRWRAYDALLFWKYANIIDLHCLGYAVFNAWLVGLLDHDAMSEIAPHYLSLLSAWHYYLGTFFLIFILLRPILFYIICRHADEIEN